MSNLTKRERTYIAACPDGDCRLQKTDLIRVNKTAELSAHCICREHRGIIYAIEFKECMQCHKPFTVPVISKRATCLICELKNKATVANRKLQVSEARIKKQLAKKEKTAVKTVNVKQNKAVEEKIRLATEKHNNAQMRRAEYCSWMKSCIANHVLRCDGCRKFEGVFFGYDPGIKCA